MSFEIVSRFASFKNSILYDNRFFISSHPFLTELKTLIEQDLKREHPIMISTLSEESILYRARIMDDVLNNNRYSITKNMKQYGIELAMAECCKACGDSNGCVKSTGESAREFSHLARQLFKDIAISSESNLTVLIEKTVLYPLKKNMKA